MTTTNRVCGWCFDYGDAPRCAECGKVRKFCGEVRPPRMPPPRMPPPCDDPFRSHPYRFWVVVDAEGKPLIDADSIEGSAVCGSESRLFAYREPGEAAARFLQEQEAGCNFDAFSMCHESRLEEFIESVAFIIDAYKHNQRGAMLGIEHAEECLEQLLSRGRLK